MIRNTIFLFFGFYLINYIECHVSLLYPPPRHPPFDFLDTRRTEGPCGVERKNKQAYTTFLTRTSYEIFWHTPIIHEGGFRISLINKKGDLQEQLTPNDGTFYENSSNSTTNSFKIRFKNKCLNCTLVLEKEQKEWKDSGIFHSCSDIQIIDNMDENNENIDETRCSGHGTFNGVSCDCDALYTGSRCEFKSFCKKDSDCKNGGKCIEMINNPVEKNCYCKFGNYGTKCEKSFIPTESDSHCFNFYYPTSPDNKRFVKYGLYNPTCYQKHKFNDEDIVYFRNVNEELEIILDFKTTSWLSIGWRPLELDSSCRLFPEIGNNKNGGFLPSALESSLHPMDCNDIIFGAVRDNYLRINDMYSRDRSTPLLDSILDGENSLTAAYGAEIKESNRSVIMFRRNIREIEPTDMPLGPGKMNFIWAKGFDDSNNEFYEKDSFTYHGLKNRGSAIFEMISKENMPVTGKIIFIPDSNQSVLKISSKVNEIQNTTPIKDINEKNSDIKELLKNEKDIEIFNKQKTKITSRENENLFIKNNKSSNSQENNVFKKDIISSISNEEEDNSENINDEEVNSKSVELNKANIFNITEDTSLSLSTSTIPSNTTSDLIVPQNNSGKLMMLNGNGDDSKELNEDKIDTSNESFSHTQSMDERTKNSLTNNEDIILTTIPSPSSNDEDVSDDTSLFSNEKESSDENASSTTQEIIIITKKQNKKINDKSFAWTSSNNTSSNSFINLNDNVVIENVDSEEISSSSKEIFCISLLLLTISIHFILLI
uniref:EGF-like domain-containing protein n=1 Tax=Parastrongyloides trichosuri TaxID=131310 RepID=A0A0N4ZXD1_PARTI